MTPLPIRQFTTEFDERLDAWRSAHKAACAHLRGCQACGAALCDDGQLLWDMADLTERGLPWRAIRRIETAQFIEPGSTEGDRPSPWADLVALVVFGLFLLACVALGWAIAKGGLI
jgi:hypothetical protein